MVSCQPAKRKLEVDGKKQQVNSKQQVHLVLQGLTIFGWMRRSQNFFIEKSSTIAEIVIHMMTI